MASSSYIEDVDEEEEEDYQPTEIDIRQEAYKNDKYYCTHLILKHAWESNFGAPIRDLLCSKPGIKVLDFGCGSGFWTLEMATDFPSSKFYGVSPVLSFPQSVLPKNVEFTVSNIITDSLPYKDAEFDYVFSRNIMFVFPKPNFESVAMKEILRVVKPGGYIEIIEEEVTVGHNRGEALEHWNINGLKPLLESYNVDYELIFRFKEYLASINQLKDVKEEKLKISIGKPNGFIGELAAELIMCVVRSMADTLTPIMKISNEEYENLIEKIEKEVSETGKEDSPYFCFRRYFAIKA